MVCFQPTGTPPNSPNSTTDFARVLYRNITIRVRYVQVSSTGWESNLEPCGDLFSTVCEALLLRFWLRGRWLHGASPGATEKGQRQARGKQRRLKYTSSITPLRSRRKPGTGGKTTFLPLRGPLVEDLRGLVPVESPNGKDQHRGDLRPRGCRRRDWRGAGRARAGHGGRPGPRRCGAGTADTNPSRQRHKAYPRRPPE